MKCVLHLFYIFLLVVHSMTAWALPIETCRNENKNYRTRLVSGLEELEKIFVQYRWTEAKIRQIYYEDLWRVRTEANDPLSREKRDRGQELEKRIFDLLKPLQRDSEHLSNAFVRQVQKLKMTDGAISELCQRRDVQTCLMISYQPFFAMMDQGLEIFNRIFEHEREYRVKVENSSGGRDGLYPEDVLESAHDHTDYYWRFEQPQSEERFQEDANLMRHLGAAQKFLIMEDAGEGCCRQCV